MSRRSVLATPAAAIMAPRTFEAPVPRLVVSGRGDVRLAEFAPSAFGTVGVYDIDWLLQPRFTRLLDNLAASPGAFTGVRVFGAFTAGQLEDLAPEGGGAVWPSLEAPIDFATTFAALEELTSRGLTPFVSLGFFPGTVSPSPVVPPSDWLTWKQLVIAFLQQLAADPRFGRDAIANWRFEVWNEPNEGRFWHGSADDYLALYQATSEAVTASGMKIRLGGPAIAYKPQVDPTQGAPWLERFLRFIAADPSLHCEFVSFHRKGTVGSDPPDPRRLWEAAMETAELALAIDPLRFAGLTIINDEADEKVGFETPYAPRLDHRNAAWLTASASMHAELTGRYRAHGFRFVAAADNADLQLVQAPFDGRRSIMTRARVDYPADLLKIPAYGFYELLRLQATQTVEVLTGRESLFPATDLHMIATADHHAVALLATYYPAPDETAAPRIEIDLSFVDLDWPSVNNAQFRIDQTLSNSYSTAGGSAANLYPVPQVNRLADIRASQEIALARPIERGVAVSDRTYRLTLSLEPYATVCSWITPVSDLVPAAPTWLETRLEDGNIVLRWTPNHEPWFFSYQVVLMAGDTPGEPISPDPLRSAVWIDTAPSPGSRAYAVRAMSASGVAGPFAVSDVVTIPV